MNPEARKSGPDGAVRKLHVEDRPRQETPGQMVAELMEMIRGQFYGDAGAKTWLQEQGYIKRNVVLWPAKWLANKGVTLPPQRYRAILLDKLQDIKRHCEQAEFKYLPAYIERCVKDHFRHNGEAIYEEGKAFRGTLERVVGKLSAAPQADPIAALAAAASVLKAKRKKTSAKPAAQKELFE